MSRSMKSEQQELLSTLSTADESQNKVDSGDEKGELLERHQVPGSPFWILGNKVDGYWLAFGKYRLSELMNTEQDILDFLESNMFDVIGYMCACISEITYNDKIKNGKIAESEKVD